MRTPLCRVLAAVVFLAASTNAVFAQSLAEKPKLGDKIESGLGKKLDRGQSKTMNAAPSKSASKFVSLSTDDYYDQAVVRLKSREGTRGMKYVNRCKALCQRAMAQKDKIPFTDNAQRIECKVSEVPVDINGNVVDVRARSSRTSRTAKASIPAYQSPDASVDANGDVIDVKASAVESGRSDATSVKASAAEYSPVASRVASDAGSTDVRFNDGHSPVDATTETPMTTKPATTETPMTRQSGTTTDSVGMSQTVDNSVSMSQRTGSTTETPMTQTVTTETPMTTRTGTTDAVRMQETVSLDLVDNSGVTKTTIMTDVVLAEPTGAATRTTTLTR